MTNQTAPIFRDTISPRAIAIVRGLRRSGRSPQTGGAISLVDDPSWVTVERDAGGFFFVSIDGAELRRGEDLADAELLQDGFREAMARLGGEKIVEAA